MPDAQDGADTGADPPLGRLGRVEAWALRAPIAVPVVTSFGTMRDRPMVLVRVTADDGVQGWGEAWCNFPGVGAEHRARLLIDTVAPLAVAGGRDWPDAPALWRHLDRVLHVLAIQTGEPGPLAQCAAAVDIACWDLAARRAGLPLWRALDASAGAAASAPARVYASGLHPDQALQLARLKRSQGHRAFKMKVGFADPAADARRLAELRAELGADATLMVDANQAWAPDDAPARIAPLLRSRPLWVEEPIAADRPLLHWSMLAERLRGSGTALAAGENLRGEAAFDALVDSGAVCHVQPDLGKWGGLTGCRAVALHAARGGAQYCPHWLGGPIGLLASMHLRAAMGDDGWVEWDANRNPLHQPLADQLPAVHEGRIALGDAPGLGPQVDPGPAWGAQITWQGSV